MEDTDDVHDMDDLYGEVLCYEGRQKIVTNANKFCIITKNPQCSVTSPYEAT